MLTPRPWQKPPEIQDMPSPRNTSHSEPRVVIPAHRHPVSPHSYRAPGLGPTCSSQQTTQ